MGSHPTWLPIPTSYSHSQLLRAVNRMSNTPPTMYQFNISLFTSLPSLLGFPTANAFRAALGKSNSFYYNVVHKQDIVLTDLMDICTLFSLNLDAFFTHVPCDQSQVPSPMASIPNPTYTLAWTKSPVVIDGNKLPKSWISLMPKSVAFTTRQRYLRPDHTATITAKIICYVCNSYNLHPSQFWIENNKG